MLHIAVFDDKPDIGQLNEMFSYHAFNRKTEYDVTFFVGRKGLERIEKYAHNLHIAFVSIYAKGCQEFCLRLNQKNPNCRICYYSANEMLSVDISNPLWFMDGESTVFVKESMAKQMDQLFHGLREYGNLLTFDTRQFLYMIPIEEVLYFQSDLKYVNVICKNAEKISIYIKLDKVETILSGVFLRIHKSYIVNKAYIKKIDKTNRTIILNTDEELPISNSHYQKVLKELSP